jgi:hypothetical protein
MNRSFEDSTVTVGERLGQHKAYVIESSRARSELGWQPHIDLRSGITEVIDWVSANWPEIPPSAAGVHPQTVTLARTRLDCEWDCADAIRRFGSTCFARRADASSERSVLLQAWTVEDISNLLRRACSRGSVRQLG